MSPLETAPGVADPLSEEAVEAVARRFAALGEPTRLRLVAELRLCADATVQQLATAVGASMPNVSRHLQVLYNAGIVRRQKDGTQVRYRLSGQAVTALVEYSLRVFGTSGPRFTRPETRDRARTEAAQRGLGARASR